MVVVIALHTTTLTQPAWHRMTAGVEIREGGPAAGFGYSTSICHDRAVRCVLILGGAAWGRLARTPVKGGRGGAAPGADGPERAARGGEGRGMTTLYVTEPRATVRSRREGLEVTMAGSPAEAGSEGPGTAARTASLRVGLHRLEVVVLVGRAHITAEAMRACAGEGVAVVLMDRGGRVRARMTPESCRSADLRLLQYAAHQDAAARLERAARIVEAKAWNAVEALVERQSNDPMNPALPVAIAALKDRARAVRAAGSVESLLGHEGTAARLYFQALATTFRGPIAFCGRRQPPGPRPGQLAALPGLHPAGQPAGRSARSPRPRPGPGSLPRDPSRQAQPGPGPARGTAPPHRGPIRDQGL